MSPTVTRALTRAAIALTAIALGACADTTTTPTSPLASPRLAMGDQWTVTNPGGGLEGGSLRWVLSFATGGETIRFAPELAGATIVLDTTIYLANPVTIEGPADRGVTISAGGKGRIFEIQTNGGDTTVLRNLTLTGAYTPKNAGGAIHANSPFVLDHVTVTGNTAYGMAAFYANGVMLINSTISGNKSIGVTTTGTPFVTMLAGKLVAINSTIAGNDAGIAFYKSTVLHNTIIAGNGPRNCEIEPAGTTSATYLGHNITDDGTCGGPNDITIVDPKLAPLADNGGPGMTMQLAYDSPAVNAGGDCAVTTDERYVARDAQCDIGAYESIDPTTVTITIDGAATVDARNGWAYATGTVQCSHDASFDLAVSMQEVVKVKGTSTIQAAASTPVACGPAPRPWSAALAPASGTFTTGTGTVAVATANTKAWVTPASATGAVRLFLGKR